MRKTFLLLAVAALSALSTAAAQDLPPSAIESGGYVAGSVAAATGTGFNAPRPPGGAVSLPSFLAQREGTYRRAGE